MNINDELTAAIDAYNHHMSTLNCRHSGATHAVTCQEGARLMRKIEELAKQMGAR